MHANASCFLQAAGDLLAARLHKTGVHVVFDHPAMFDDQPASLLPVFTKTGPGGAHRTRSSTPPRRRQFALCAVGEGRIRLRR